MKRQPADLMIKTGNPNIIQAKVQYHSGQGSISFRANSESAQKLETT